MQLGVSLGIPYTLGKPAAVFSPLDLSPVLWLDASDTSTITESGGAVSQWDDKSGNGYNVTQGTAANQPTTGTRTINSRNVLDFDGSDALVSAYGIDLVTSKKVTVFTVAQLDDITNPARIVAFARNGVNDYQSGVLIAQTTSTMNVTIGEGDVGGNYAVRDVTYTATTPALLRFAVSASPASVSLNINGASQTLTLSAGTLATSDWLSAGTGNHGAWIGARNNLSVFLDGAIAEVIAVDDILTAGEIAATESYLADKWGITI